MGFFYLALLLGWFFMLRMVAYVITLGMDSRDKRWTAAIFIVIAYPLPLADEIVGAVQLTSLCASLKPYVAPDADKKKGTNIIYIKHEEEYLEGKAIPMISKVHEYVSESDRAPIIRYTQIHAQEGWLGQKFDLNGSSNPLSFDGWCDVKVRHAIFTDYHVVN